MIGSCSSAGRNLKTKRSSASGKTLATTCKTKKAGSKTTTKPVTKAVVKKTAPKPKPVAKKSAVMVKPKTNSNSGLKIEDLVGTKIYIEDGYGVVGTLVPWTREQIIEKIRKNLWYNLFNQNFYYNYTSSDTKNEYYNLFIKTIIEPYTKNINKTLRDWFELNDPKSDSYFQNGKILEIKQVPSNWIDKWFMKTPMSDKLRNEYKAYRKKQFSVTL